MIDKIVNIQMGEQIADCTDMLGVVEALRIHVEDLKPHYAGYYSRVDYRRVYVEATCSYDQR